MDRIPTSLPDMVQLNELLDSVMQRSSNISEIMDNPNARMLASEAPEVPRNSRALINSSNAGQRARYVPVADLVKEQMSLRNQEAIIRAARDLNNMPGARSYIPPQSIAPQAATRIGSGMLPRLLGPQLGLILEALFHSGELNSNEPEELAKRRAKGYKE